jgi:uncharacterized membrane protein (UPF0127 family)
MLAVVCVAMVAGCNPEGNETKKAGGGRQEGEPQMGLPEVTMPIGSKTFTLEVATTPRQHSTGLMYRDSMAPDHGMIFVFPEDHDSGFWMKHTRIPLDILYVDKTGTVVSVHQMQPFDLTAVVPQRAYRYAIELNQGTAAGVGVKAGDQLVIPEGARSPGK